MRFFFTLLFFFSLSQVQLSAQTSGCNVNYINPLDGSKINSPSTTTLVWQNIPGAATYDLWFGIGGSYGLIATVPQGINGTTTYTVNNLNGSTIYKWYPVAKNAAGGYVQSCFPVSASFTTADSPVPPACTYNVEPQNGAILITQTTAQLTWASAPSATSYDIYLWSGNVAPTQPFATAASGAYFYNATGLLAGTTYHWYVTPRNTAGPATNCIYTQANFTTASTIPGNDDCTGALEVIPGTIVNSCGPTVVATTIGATASPVPACTGSAEDDIWFKFTPSSKRNKISVVTFAVINPVIEIFSGSCSSLTSIGCYTTTLAPYPTAQSLSTELPALVPGQTYYYRVYGSGSSSERTKINTCITAIPDAPSNDECSAALLLTANADTSKTYSYTGATGYASQSMVSCVDPNYIAPDIWFKFVATAASQKISVIPGISSDYAFQAFGGDCGNLTPLACINNGGYGQPDTTVLNNLIVGNTYYLRVWDYHGDGAPFAPFKIVINTTKMPVPPSSTNGLQAVYYNGTTLSGTPLLTRIDTSINYELTYSKQPVILSPAPGVVPEDGYSVRWTGKVQAKYSELYTFYTLADDGIRLWVNGQLLVDNWTNQGATEKSGTIALTAGQQYDIVIEYYENTGEAVTKLLWSSPSTPKAVIPASQFFPTNSVTPALPSCTINISPANASFISTATTATLQWNASANASSYDVYLWKGSSIPNIPIANTTSVSYSVTDLSPLTYYSWYVIPKNSTGAASGCVTSLSGFTTALGPAPANDECTGALNVIAGTSSICYDSLVVIGNNNGATRSLPDCIGSAEDDIWFKFTATSHRHKIMVSTTELIYPVLELFSGNCSALTSLGCHTNTGVSSPNLSVELLDLIPGQAYYYRVFGSGGGNLRLPISTCITTIPPAPSNDDCSGAIQLTANADAGILYSYTGTIGYASQSQPSCVYSYNNAADVWFTFTAAASSQKITVTPPADLNYAFQIYSGTCNNLNSLACVNSGGANQPDSVTINLTKGNTYYMRVYDYNGNNNPLEQFTIVINTSSTTPPETSTGTGLRGQYFNGISLSNTPLLTRTDSSINFELTYSKQPVVLSPAPGIVPEDLYSVRWSGQVQAQYSENYTFYTVADDGIRLWVNGVKLVDNWVNQGVTEKSGSINLVAGQKYDIVVEYYENAGEAVTKLLWSSTSTAKGIIPASQLYPTDGLNSTVPLCITNISPVNGATVPAQTTATLVWPKIANASSYYIYFGQGNTLAGIANMTDTSYTVTGLRPATVYKWYIAPINATGTAVNCGAANTTTFTTADTSSIVGDGTGLLAEYYNNTTLTLPYAELRKDAAINNDFAFVSPSPGIVNIENYSVRWRGQVQAQYNETYTFYTNTDDGVRLWVNGVLLVDNWVNQGATEKSGSIALAAKKKYNIVMEYYQGTGYAVSQLLWSSPSTPKAIVPGNQLYMPPVPLNCAPNILPANNSTLTEKTSAYLKWETIFLSDEKETPVYDLYLWTGTDVPQSPQVAGITGAEYTVTGLLPGTTYNWYVLPRNSYGIGMNCVQGKTNFTTKSDVQVPPGTGTGLQGTYYNGTGLAGTPLLTRIDSSINFELTYSKQPLVLSPAPGIVPEDLYSVRWTGQVQPLYSETYTFYTVADDGVRLWVNGVQLVDNWTNQGATEKSGSIALLAGQKYDIVIEYYESAGEAVTKLLWSSASTPKQIVPSSQLYPPPAGARIMNSNLPVIAASVLPASPAVSAQLSPNPVSPGNLARLQISSNKAATGTITVSSSNGRMVSTEKLKLVTGLNTAMINTRGLAQGLYIISVTGGSKPLNLKLLVE